MATINCTNQKAAIALEGQSVVVTLSAAESLSVLPVLAEGQAVTNNSNSAKGIIASVDAYGHSFKVKPVQPNTQFNTGTTGKLAEAELLTVTY